VRLVIHDDENDWCVGDDVNDPNVDGACIIVHITHVLARDSSVAELASLPPGWAAARTVVKELADPDGLSVVFTS
jgi:hypothetical protein